MITQVLPSAHHIDEFVDLNFGPKVLDGHGNTLIEASLKSGQVKGVHFKHGKILYDLEFTVSIDDDGRKTTRIHNIDSAFVDKKIINSKGECIDPLAEHLLSLSQWKREQLQVWGPVLNFMHNQDLKPGSSISEKVLDILKQHYKK
jgi:hypothetical protein